MQHSHLPRLALATALTVSLITGAAKAAEWVAEPSVSLREDYNDNIRLTAAPHDTVLGTTLDPRLKLSRRGELWDINATGRLRASQYTGEDNLNTTDNFLDVAAQRKLERGSWDINASQVNDTTLQDELLDLDTGLVNAQVDRTTRDLQFAGQYMFTEATWVEASVDYSTVEYDEGQQYGLLDYDYLVPGLRVIHQLSPQLQMFGILNHSTVDYDTDTDLKSKTNNLQFGTSYNITETWKVSGSLGSRRTNTSSLIPDWAPPAGLPKELCTLFPVCEIVFVPTDTESTGLVYDAALTRKFENGGLNLSATRSVTPSSTGTNTDTTQITFSGTRNFSAKLSARLAVSYNQSSTVGDTTTQADNTQYRIAPSLAWRLSEYLALNAGYTYTRIEHDNSGMESADSNTIFASLGYTWPRLAVSR